MRGGAFVLVLAMVQAQPIAARQAAAPAAPPQPRVGWQIDWANNRCVLTRLAGPNQHDFSVRLVPGSSRPELLVVVDPATVKVEPGKPAKATLELQPSGFRSEVDFGTQPIANTQSVVLGMGNLDPRFLADFPKSEEIAVSIGEVRMSLPIRTGARAMDALQNCVDDGLTEQGLDPEAIATLRDQPEGDWRKLVTPSEYPQAALRARKSGAVQFRAVVDAEGRISKCTVVQGSGTKELDDKTCAVLKKARFKPAVAADGSKVAAPLVDTMVWEPAMPTQGRR